MAERCRRCDREGCEWPLLEAMDWSEFDEQDPKYVEAVEEGCDQNRVDWRARALAAEAKLPTDADRADLKTAAIELREYLGFRRSELQRLRHVGADSFVVDACQEGIAACEAAVAVCERLAKGGG